MTAHTSDIVLAATYL